MKHFLQKTRKAVEQWDFVAFFLLRLYLIFPLWMAGTTKWQNIESTAQWFEHGLNVPFPAVSAYLTSGLEIAGAVLLALGLAVRFISFPLLFVMAAAAFLVHWEQGWSAIADQGSEAVTRLEGFLGWLKSEYPGRHGFITELGRPVILNNGIEFAATYFIMIATLFFKGGGKYLSMDYWIARKLGITL